MAPVNKGLNDSEKKLVDFINAGELESTRFFGKVALIFWAFSKSISVLVFKNWGKISANYYRCNDQLREPIKWRRFSPQCVTGWLKFSIELEEFKV